MNLEGRVNRVRNVIFLFSFHPSSFFYVFLFPSVLFLPVTTDKRARTSVFIILAQSKSRYEVCAPACVVWGTGKLSGMAKQGNQLEMAMLGKKMKFVVRRTLCSRVSALFEKKSCSCSSKLCNQRARSVLPMFLSFIA